MTNHELITKLAFGHYLEIGVNEGFSLAAALANPQVTFAVGIDPWTETYGGFGRGSPDHVVKLLGDGASRTLLITGKSEDVLPKLTHQFDCIFVDGDHSPQGALYDLTVCASRLLKPTGVMLVDDTDNVAHPYIREICMEFAVGTDMTIVIHPAHCGVAEMRRRSA